MASVGISDKVGIAPDAANPPRKARLVAVEPVAEATPVDFDLSVADVDAAFDAPVDHAVWAEVEARLATAQIDIGRKDYAAVAQALDPAAFPLEAPLSLQLSWAEVLADANAAEASDAVFETMMRIHPGERTVHVAYAKRLHTRGFAIRALQVLEQVADALTHGTKALALLKRVRHLCNLLQTREGGEIDAGTDCRLLAMKHAIGAYSGRTPRALAPDRIGRLSLITGSLGPGGAERQLSRTAAEMEIARVRDGQIGGIAIDRPVEVLVRSHGPEQQHDFFLPDLQATSVDLFEINRMPAQAPATFGVEDRDLVALLEYLPIKVNFGTRRLVAHFRESMPDIVSVWQDGACLFAGLAAVIAGVPKIQMVIRGLPPVIRKHMFQPEYEVMYRALAAVPGVEFISNSKAAAIAYAEWLDVPIERFGIVYNGVPKMECTASPELDARWSEFDARTADADQTIGGVFRFDTDKRPTTWIRFAARYAKKHPKARFVVVGAGRLLDDCVRLAEELHLTDRLLFVGRSTDVGYWMKKMDVLVLMSSFEGLPNVLIEAQYLGVPVVSTPAGGASECFIEGVTGHILGCADKTDRNEACEKVHALLGRAQRDDIFGPATRDFLEPNFSVSRMLENFVHVTCGRARA